MYIATGKGEDSLVINAVNKQQAAKLLMEHLEDQCGGSGETYPESATCERVEWTDDCDNYFEYVIEPAEVI